MTVWIIYHDKNNTDPVIRVFTDYDNARKVFNSFVSKAKEAGLDEREIYGNPFPHGLAAFNGNDYMHLFPKSLE